MRKIIHILNIFILFISIIHSESAINVAWFNFNDNDIDSRSEVIVNLSKQISDKFIDIMKEDMIFIRNINFISTKELNKELNRINKEMLNAIIPSFKEDFSGYINRNSILEGINNASDRLTDKQINFLADSIMTSIQESTKDITKDMMDAEKGSSNIEMSTLYNSISDETKQTLKKHIFSSLIASSKQDFSTDIIVTGQYSIIDNEINVKLFLYNYEDFSLIDSVHSKAFMNKGNILIKDLEFKLLTKLGVILNNLQKEKLCEYDIENFSKKYYSLYFSNIFESNDIKEIKYRFQIDDNYNFLNNHYETFFNSLVGNKIRYKIKFYNDDSYYNVFYTQSANNSSVFIDVLKSNWFNKVGEKSSMDLSNKSKQEGLNAQTIIEVNYSNIESIYFSKGQDNFIELLKQIAIYSSILGSVFLLGILI